MGEKLIKSFETSKVNPFQLKNVRLCHSLVELSQIIVPKVQYRIFNSLNCYLRSITLTLKYITFIGCDSKYTGLRMWLFS